MSLPIPAGSYGIDAVHSQLGFSVTHLGISVVRGTLDQFDGSLTVGERLEDTTVEIDAVMASVNSGNPARDEVLGGDNFFGVANHPGLSFRSTAVTENNDGYDLAGELTIRDITQPVVLAVSYNGSAVFPMDGSTHFGFGATGQISRSAFGISYGVPMVTDEVDLHLEAQFIQPATT